MTENEFKEQLSRSLSGIKNNLEKKSVMLAREQRQEMDVTLEQLSLFSHQTPANECERIINNLQNIIRKLEIEVSGEEHQLQAEMNGGQIFTPDELERLNEYAYRRELLQWLQCAQEMLYEVRPEFKPK